MRFFLQILCLPSIQDVTKTGNSQQIFFSAGVKFSEGSHEAEDFRICLLVNILIFLLPYHCTLCIEYFKAIKVHHHSDSILRQTFSKSKI